MNYQDYTKLNSSEKIILAHVHSVRRLFNFTLTTGSYKKVTPYFVVGVKFNGTTLQPVETIDDLTSSTFFYDITTSSLYLKEYVSADEVIATYRHFFSNQPINLSWDLEDYSEEVEYLPRISGYPNFKSTMSSKKGISLTGSGSLVLINTDDTLTQLFDKNIFENKDVEIYSTHRELLPSQAQILFRGSIQGKNLALNAVTLSLKDDIYSLEQPIPLKKFDTLVIDEEKDNLQRMIFGRVQNLKMQPINQVEKGYAIQGTITGYLGDEFITGTNTTFLQDVSSGDTLIFQDFELDVDEVLSNTSIKVSALERNFYNLSANLKPRISHYNKNRVWHVCSHEIEKPTMTITDIICRNRVVVDSTLNFKAGDKISLNDLEQNTIRRISGNTIVLNQNYNFNHSVGETISKVELENVRFNNRLLFPEDYTITNSPSGTYLTFTNRAEFNQSIMKTEKTNFRFYNGKNKIWLGSPTFINIICVGNVKTGDNQEDYSLFGKYFTIKDEDGATCAFWFKDNVVDENSIIKKPSAVQAIDQINGNKSQKIELESREYSSSEIAQIIGTAISNELSCWTHSLNGSTCQLESKEAVSISNGDANTSGFSFSIVSGTASNSKVKMSNILKSRDFVKASYQSDSQLIEVLEVGEKYAVLRSNYQGDTKLDNLSYLNVDYFQDDSIITCDSYGKTGITSPIETIEYLLNLCGISYNQASFDECKTKVLTTVSLSLPLDFGDKKQPKLKDIIQLLSVSCNGGVFLNSDLELSYSLIDADVYALDTIKDYDVISWSYQDDNFDSALTTIGEYNFQDYSQLTKEKTNNQTQFTSEIAQKYTEQVNSNTYQIYLKDESESLNVIQRLAFLNGLSSKTIKIKGGLGLSNLKIGQKVRVDLKRHKGIGQISSMTNNGSQVDLEIVDFGSLMKFCSKITTDTYPSYQDATTQEKEEGSFITDSNGTIDDVEETFNFNLIS